jgi:hypothetical protein
MANRFHPKWLRARPIPTRENLSAFLKMVPPRGYLISILLVMLGLATFVYGISIGGNVFFGATRFFYDLSLAPVASPTPQPPLPKLLPQIGTVLYTVQDGDSCDAILVYQMRMNQASEIFSDVKPETVQALNSALGKDCHRLQPGEVLALSPHYPLVALGGTVEKVAALSPHQVLPTPLIHVHNTEPQAPAATPPGPDCSRGCALTVQIAPHVSVRLEVQTTLKIREGSWVWAQAMMARKRVAGIDNYPYVNTTTKLEGMSLHACDFQVDDVHDDNSLSCTQLRPNTINADGGSWLFGVTGAGALDHWHYPIHLPPNTRVLLWLTVEKGTLIYHQGDPLFRYNERGNTYQKIT